MLGVGALPRYTRGVSWLVFWVAVAFLGLGWGMLGGGHPAQLLSLRLRGGWLLLALVLADLLLLPRLIALPALEGVLLGLTAGTAGGLILLLLWNWHVFRPLPLWLGGLTLNAAYLLANGGRHYVVRPAAFAASSPLIALPETVALPWLAAWIPLPPDGWLSPGDLLIALGVVLALRAALRPPGG